MKLWKSVVGKLWMTIMLLVAVVLLILGFFLLQYIDIHFTNSYNVKKLFIYTAIIGFLLTTFFAFFLSNRITKPLVQMKEVADMIRVGEYGTRVPVISRDEIGELAKTLNHMAEELSRNIRDLNIEKEHLASVLKSMTDALLTFDASGRLMLANPPGEHLLQEWRRLDEHDEALGIPLLGDDGYDGHEVPEPLFASFKEVVREARGTTARVSVRSRVYSVVMTPLYSNYAVLGVVAVVRDMTEEYRLDKLRKDFVANVSHELRTPIAMLQGYSEALLDGIADSVEERREIAQIINEESLRMGRLVGDLLDLARMEGGYAELQWTRLEAAALVGRVFRKFQVMAKDKGIRLELRVPDEKLTLVGDEDRLEQVLTNLLDNAIRHTPQGRLIRLTTEGIRYRDRRLARFIVQDFGEGIPEQDLPYIFERFYKADKARTRGQNGGTGLGLAIVRNIVEAHSGTIRAESEVGAGTVFTIDIPCERMEGN